MYYNGREYQIGDVIMEQESVFGRIVVAYRPEVVDMFAQFFGVGANHAEVAGVPRVEAYTLNADGKPSCLETGATVWDAVSALFARLARAEADALLRRQQQATRHHDIEVIQHNDIDCEGFADVARRHGVAVECLCPLEDVAHVGFGGCVKLRYVSPKTGKTLYVIERGAPYAPDGYANECWVTETDFSEADAAAIVAAHDAKRDSERRIQSEINQLLRYYKDCPSDAANESWTSDPSGGGLTPEEFEEARRRFLARRVKPVRDLQVGDQLQTSDGLYPVAALTPRTHEETQRDYLMIDLGRLTYPLTMAADREVDYYV